MAIKVKASGKMAKCMVKERKSGLTAMSTKVISKKTFVKALVSSLGKMELNTRAILETTRLKDSGLRRGTVATSTRVNGKMDK